MTIHYGGFGLRNLFSSDSYFNNICNNFIDLGTRGPLIFYIASGYVLSISFSRIRNFRTFILIRYLRLMPLYFCITVFAYLTKSVDDFNAIIAPDNAGANFNLAVLIKKLFFLDIFFKDAYYFSPVSIAPFIVIEFWLSVLLVLLYFKKPNPFLILIISFSIYYLARHIPFMIGGNSFKYEILRSQFWFVLGIILTQIKLKIKFSGLYTILLFFLSVIFPSLSAYSISAAAALYLSNEKDYSRKLYPLIFIGNICFSIYLLHLPIHYFIINILSYRLSYVSTSGLVIFLSMFTFFLLSNLLSN